jgi:hypothetical protein
MSRLLALPAAVDFRAPADVCEPIEGQAYDTVPTVRAEVTRSGNGHGNHSPNGGPGADGSLKKKRDGDHAGAGGFRSSLQGVGAHRLRRGFECLAVQCVQPVEDGP